MMRRATRWAVAAALVGVLGGEADAGACGPYSRKVRDHVVGVGPDGTFVVASAFDPDTNDDATPSLKVYDADGDQVASIVCDGPEEPWQVSSEDEDITQALEPLLAGEKGLAGAEAALRRHYQLTPLHRSRLEARVPRGPEGCEWMRVATPEGALPVLDIQTPRSTQEADCSGIATTILEHPSSTLLFVRVAYRIPLDDEGHVEDVDDVRWLPAVRLSGARLAERGRRELAAGRVGAALIELDQALTVAPEYLPARLWSMQALAAGHRPASLAQGWLEHPCPQKQPWVGGNSDEVNTWLQEQAPPAWEARSWGGLGVECAAHDEDADASAASDQPGTTDGLPTLATPSPTIDAPAPPGAPGRAEGRSVWWFDPGSALLGAGAVVAYALGYRRGFASRR